MPRCIQFLTFIISLMNKRKVSDLTEIILGFINKMICWHGSCIIRKRIQKIFEGEITICQLQKKNS
jgi:hypothetical protein